MPSHARPLAAAALALTLFVGVAACSGDDDSSTEAAPGDDAPAAATDGGGSDDGEGRPFDVGREDLAESLATATSASDHRVDGNTIVLVFDEGSKDDVGASINCSVGLGLKGTSDQVRLEYPDGDIDCEEPPEAGQ